MKNPSFACFGLAVALIAAPALAESRYVALTGSDANPGTRQKPFRTLQKAADIAQAGDIVYVRAGTYRETVRPAQSGAEGRPIVYQPYEKEKVTINGTALVSSPWAAAGNGLYVTDWPAE